MGLRERSTLLLAAAILLLGCNGRSTVPNSDPVAVKKSTAEPVLVSGNSYRTELTRKALRGLDYSSGRVTIDSSLSAELTNGLRLEDANELWVNGQRALASGNAIESIELLTKAVILAPQRADFLESLGVTLLAKKKTNFAEAAFRTALELNPDSAFAHEKLGLTLSGTPNRFRQAIEHYQKSVNIEPENGHVYSRIAILNYYLGQTNSAREFATLAALNDYAVPPQFKSLLEHGRSTPQLSAGALPKVGKQIRVDIGNELSGNETTAASSDIHPDCVVAGWNDYRNGSSANTGIAISNDEGATWEDFILHPPIANQNQTEGDPMTAYDNRTGNLWAGAISFGGGGGVFVARKSPDDTDFQPAVMATVTGGADKCWMAAGPDPSNAKATRLYIGYNQGLLVSVDEGDTWSGPIAFPEFGLGWLPRVGPNGELYLTYWDVNDGIKLLRSFDGGVTLEGPINIATRMDVWFIDGTRFPGRFRCAPLVTSAVDPIDGTLFATWSDTTNIIGDNSNVDIYFSKSIDQGTTWSTPNIVNTDANVPGDQFFSWIEVDASGRLHVLFYDSRSVEQDDNIFDDAGNPSCLLQTYYAFSDDDGDSWTEIVLTPESFDTADAGFDGAFIGDYLGMGVSGTTAFPCYMTTSEGTANIFVQKIDHGFVIGDLNGDGQVTLLDIQPFVDAIVSGQFQSAADINSDGKVNLGDVADFVLLLLGDD